LRVLVVEDSLINQRVAEGLLQHLGHDPVIVDSGQEALEAVEEATFDLVLMDIEMLGMDGIETAQRMRDLVENGEGPRITALTARASDEDRRMLLEAGLDDYVACPWTSRVSRPRSTGSGPTRTGSTRSRRGPRREAFVSGEGAGRLCGTAGTPSRLGPSPA